MATAQAVWCREDRKTIGSYPTVNDANAAIRRIVQHSGGGPGEPGRKNYDVVAVTV